MSGRSLRLFPALYTYTVVNMITDSLTVSWWRKESRPSPSLAAAFRSRDADLLHLLS